MAKEESCAPNSLATHLILCNFNWETWSLQCFFFSLNVDKNNRSNSIPTWILELLNIEISDQPAILFSQSLSPGIFPSILKISKIIPIYKKWSKLECSSYWSMSLLSNTEKILARLIHNRLCSKRDLKKRTDISTPM